MKISGSNPGSGSAASDPSSDRASNVARLLADSFVYFWIGVLAFGLITSSAPKSISYSQFLSELKKGTATELVITENQIVGVLRLPDGKKQPFSTNRVDPVLADRLDASHVSFSGGHTDALWLTAFWWIAGGIILFNLFGFLGKRAGGNPPGMFSPFAVEKNKARIYSEQNIGVTFADVAGVDEAKEELKEVVSFLKNPQEYSRLGGRLPKGILLVGPPGTGKTLLARAVAGEAGVPFFSISGSEFVELFVGVGAARVRDLFAEARQKAPAIIFIDELDALGRSRSINPMISHDEKEQTLNQLLVEMDGFDTSSGVVLLAATNRPEILDQALLRAGRFDRHILVDRPDKKGRMDILAVHMKKIVVSEKVESEKIAAMTAGFTGADLANLVNEAALLASRKKSDSVAERDFEEAIERVVAGLEKKNRILTESERKLVAHHEMGHALVGICLPSTDKVQKVSIIPHGIAALGYTVQRPTEDRFILSRTELEHKLAAMLGGRAAELLIFGESSTGAADDLTKATDLARAMVTRYGMDTRLGLATYEEEPSPYLQAPFDGSGHHISPATARQIDQAVKRLLDAAMIQAMHILTNNRTWLTAAAGTLLTEETLTEEQIIALKPRSGSAAMAESACGMSDLHRLTDAAS